MSGIIQDGAVLSYVCGPMVSIELTGIVLHLKVRLVQM